MSESDPTILTWMLAAALAGIGAAKMVGARGFASVFARIDYSSSYRTLTGALQIAAAALLSTPHFRIEGAALGGAVLFFSVVGLLEHREYRWAGLGIALLAALWLHVLFGPV